MWQTLKAQYNVMNLYIALLVPVTASYQNIKQLAARDDAERFLRCSFKERGARYTLLMLSEVSPLRVRCSCL